MMITRENYEIFVLDYLEGNLTAELSHAFQLFLDENPDIREEIESFEMIKLVASDDEFPNKDSLKRETGDLLKEIPAFERSCIASLERDQTNIESNRFRDELFFDPEKQKVYGEFDKTILKPESVSFDSKNALKKPVPIGRKKRYMIWFAAASVIILFLLTNPFSNNIQQNEGQGPSESTEIIAKSSSNVEDNGKILAEVKNVQSYTSEEKIRISKQPESIDKSLSAYSASEAQNSITKMKPEQNSIMALKSLGGILPVGKVNELSLKDPVIYIPVYLEANDLKALEALTLDDFKVKLIQEPKEEKKAVSFLLALFSSGVKGLNKTTGSNIEMETSLNENGKLTAFAFNSNNLKIRSKGRTKTAVISPGP